MGELEKAEREFVRVEGAEESRRARAQVHTLLRVPIDKVIRGMATA